MVDAAGGAGVNVDATAVCVADGAGVVGAVVAAGCGVKVGTVSGGVTTVSTTTTTVGVGSLPGRTTLIRGKSVRILEYTRYPAIPTKRRTTMKATADTFFI